MFYFFFESRDDPKNDPVVLWMTGVIIPAFHEQHAELKHIFHAFSSKYQQ